MPVNVAVQRLPAIHDWPVRRNMNRKNLRILAAVIALTGLSLFFWRLAARPEESASPLPDPTQFTPNYAYDGIVLASTSMETSEESSILRGLLGVQIWKFAVKNTKPDVKVTYILELREKGKPVKTLFTQERGRLFSDGKLDDPTLSSLYLAILPLNNDLPEANKVKFILTGHGLSLTTVIDNPLKGTQGYQTPNSDSSQKDIPLLTGHFPLQGAGSSDRTLYLRLKTESGASS